VSAGEPRRRAVGAGPAVSIGALRPPRGGRAAGRTTPRAGSGVGRWGFAAEAPHGGERPEAWASELAAVGKRCSHRAAAAGSLLCEAGRRSLAGSGGRGRRMGRAARVSNSRGQLLPGCGRGRWNLGHPRRGPPVRPARATHGWRSEQRRGGGAGTAAGERHIAHRARARKRGQQRMRARAAGRAAMATSHGHAVVRLDAGRGSARPWQGTRRAHNAPSAQLCARATARAAGVAAGTRGARARGRVSGWDTPARARGRARGCARARGRAATGRAARPCERQGSPALAAQSRSTELRGL